MRRKKADTRKECPCVVGKPKKNSKQTEESAMIKCPDCGGEGYDWVEDPYCQVRDYCIHGGRCNRKPNECNRCEGTGEIHPDCLFCGEPNTREGAKEGEYCEACTNAPKCKMCGDPDGSPEGVCLTCRNRQRVEIPAGAL